jgi:hypothetical protein
MLGLYDDTHLILFVDEVEYKKLARNLFCGRLEAISTRNIERAQPLLLSPRQQG